jgi:hypothetical protein
MDKICCCAESSLPDITVNVKCACCESHVEDHQAKDSPDFNVIRGEEESEKRDEDETICCCFRRKRHANAKKKKNEAHDGEKA